jgi:hypothetical protein
MTDKDNCKGCSATVHHSFEEVKAKMADYIKTIDPDHRTDRELYEKRLAQCASCSGLYYESTCRYCGCFVQMRALRSTMDCPNPEGSRWRGL